MPDNHHLNLTLPDGKHERYRVVYLQPKAERGRPQTAEVHILCSEWLEPRWHAAVYVTPGHSYSGRFIPAFYEDADDGWLFVGGFDGEPIDAAAGSYKIHGGEVNVVIGEHGH